MKPSAEPSWLCSKMGESSHPLDTTPTLPSQHLLIWWGKNGMKSRYWNNSKTEAMPIDVSSPCTDFTLQCFLVQTRAPINFPNAKWIHCEHILLPLFSFILYHQDLVPSNCALFNEKLPFSKFKNLFKNEHNPEMCRSLVFPCMKCNLFIQQFLLQGHNQWILIMKIAQQIFSSFTILI
jgi:hypothetical protein